MMAADCGRVKELFDGAFGAADRLVSVGNPTDRIAHGHQNPNMPGIQSDMTVPRSARTCVP